MSLDRIWTTALLCLTHLSPLMLAFTCKGVMLKAIVGFTYSKTKLLGHHILKKSYLFFSFNLFPNSTPLFLLQRNRKSPKLHPLSKCYTCICVALNLYNFFFASLIIIIIIIIMLSHTDILSLAKISLCNIWPILNCPINKVIMSWWGSAHPAVTCSFQVDLCVTCGDVSFSKSDLLKYLIFKHCVFSDPSSRPRPQEAGQAADWRPRGHDTSLTAGLHHAVCHDGAAGWEDAQGGQTRSTSANVCMCFFSFFFHFWPFPPPLPPPAAWGHDIRIGGGGGRCVPPLDLVQVSLLPEALCPHSADVTGGAEIGC